LDKEVSDNETNGKFRSETERNEKLEGVRKREREINHQRRSFTAMVVYIHTRLIDIP
jgi:hypothetical protein